MHSSPAADDTELVFQQLRRLVHGIRTFSYSVERSCGVTGAQLFVLRELAAEPGASIRRLSTRTMTDPSSVSALVARLVEQGHVARSLDSNDKRKAALALTAQGEQLLRRAPDAYQGKLVDVLRALSADELALLGKTLGRMSDSLDLPGEAPLFFEETRKRETPP